MTLPPGWVESTVAALGVAGEQTVMTGPFGSHMRASQFAASGVPVLTIGCLTDAGITLSKAAHLPEKDAAGLERYRLREGDMLFSRMASVGRAGFVTAPLAGCLFNYHLMRLRLARELYEPNLFLAYVRGAEQVRQYLEDVNHGATRDGINTEQLLAMPVAVPPRAEQRRIVAKLDAIFEQTRAARVRLERLPALLEKLKRSILAAAFRGDLTADWRAANPNAEPAKPRHDGASSSELLDRASVERRRTRPAAQASADSNHHRHELPRGWSRARLDSVADIQLGQRRAPEYAGEREYPYVRAANITWRGLDLSDVKRMGFVDAEKLFLQKGDVLLNEASGSVAEVGKPAIWNAEIPECCFQATVLRLRADTTRVLPDYLHLSCLADALLGRFAAMAPGVGILHLTSERMRNWPVAVPPLHEQRAIVDAVHASVRIVDALADRCMELLKATAQMESAALAKAFRGELVPQDPNDEPAEKVLERIRAAREAEPEKARRGRGKAKASEPAMKPAGTEPAREVREPEAVELVIAAFQNGESRLKAADIADTTGLERDVVKDALAALVESGQVRVEGKARGTTYVWTA